VIRFLAWLIGIPLAIAVAVFAVANRAAVLVTLWPLPYEVTIPTFLLVLVAAVIGFLLGGMVAWGSAYRTRRELRRRGRRIQTLEEETRLLRRRLAEGPANDAATGLAALPTRSAPAPRAPVPALRDR